MKPIIEKISLKELSPYARRKICSCEPKCESGLTITTYNDGMILCDNDAQDLLYELMSKLDAVGYTRWSQKDVDFLIKHYEEKGYYYGINRDIAKAIGKTTLAVFNKARQLRQKGLLKVGKNIQE